MKKKILAAVLSAMTLTTVSAFAAPVFSGDANLEYINQDGSDNVLKNRIRLSMDNEIAPNMYLHGRLVMNNEKNIDSANNPKVELEQVYIGGNYSGIDYKIGRQPLFLGKGIISDMNNINGIQAATKVEGLNINGFYGKDGAEKVTAVELGTAANGVNLGATYMKTDAKYYGVNFDTAVAKGVVLNGQYVKNDDADTSGYIAGLKFGDAVKAGDVDYFVSYRDIDAGAVSSYTTDLNYDPATGIKGVQVGLDYKVNNNSTLKVTQDFTKTQADVNKHRTDVEYIINF